MAAYDELTRALLKEILSYKGFDHPKNRVHLANATNYTRDGGFILYVGVAGAVQWVDLNGNTGTENFTVGYHNTPLRSIIGAGTVATDLAACF